MKNKILSIMLVVCIVQTLVLSLPIVTNAAKSGSCGEGVTWTLDSNQVLTISGKGTMEDYAYCQPWAGVQKVIIKDGVQNIGKAVFKKHQNLTSVEIGNSVKTIGNEAFRECPNLTSVKMGDGVAVIGEDAFIFCENLKNLELSDNLTEIGRCAFMFTGLTSVKIPDSVTKIDVSAFQTCKGLTTVEIPDSVLEIGWGAFSHCTGLTSVKIGEAVTKIEDEAFAGCSKLASVEMGKSVKSIYAFAFNNCDSLKNVYYNGTKNDWSKIYISSESNECLTKAKIHYAGVSGQKKISVLLNAKRVDFDVPPQIINGRTMVPIRAIFEAMGAKVTWNQNTGSVTSKKGNTTVVMQLNSVNMHINGKKVQMDVAPVIIDGRTLAPARFAAEAFGANVKWDGANNTVIITSK